MGAIQSFGSLLPTLTGTLGTVQTIARTVNAIQNFANPDRQQEQAQDLAMQQLKAQQSLQEKQLAQSAALDREKIALSAAATEEDRQKALRRAVARQRASFGASGLGASGAGGSSEAVLLGLFEESDAERAQRESLDKIRARSIDLGVQQESSLNLLQATQLAEKQNLNSLF